MAYSRIVTAGDGSTTQYAINFTLGFLSRDHVTCQVGGEVDGFGDPVYRTLTWVNDGLVDILDGDVPALAEEIVFQRTTPKDSLWHDYSDGVAIIDDHLDQSNLQNIMIAQEALDGRFAALVNDLDMGNFQIKNLADGTLAQDAVTVNQMATAIAVASGLSGAFPASGISYDPASTGLSATDVQAAIDELDPEIDKNVRARRVALFKLT